MRKLKLATLGMVALVGSMTACGDYLSGPGLTTDPNRPSQASLDQLYHGMQVSQFVWHTGNLARVSSLWMQQMAGIGRQHQNRDLYDITESDFSGDFSGLYIGGGLVDLREIQKRAEANGDRTYAGIARVWEGFQIGMAASLWGDIPYSEAVGETAKPKLDDQAAVYAAVQGVLDKAIADLQAGSGAGPGTLDLVHGGNRTKWIQTANTLKARFYMHWVEAQLKGGAAATLATTACGGNCLTKARDAAQSGISAPANNMRTFHTANAGEQNLWWQFMNVARAGDIAAGEVLVELMESRNDPRLPRYFSRVEGKFVGAPPGTSMNASMLGSERGEPDFRQPLVTYEENQLIIAEAQFRLGNPAAALVALNNARAAGGLGAVVAAGSALLQEIAIEKYIALFQNIEVWNDHKRLCTPKLTPATGSRLPARIFYGEAERNVNPNIPAPGELTARNDNDPDACS